jgi:hypothetical protein
MCSISINEKPDRESGRVFLLVGVLEGQGGGGMGLQLRRGALALGWSVFGVSAKEALCGKSDVHLKRLNGLCSKRAVQSAFVQGCMRIWAA